MRNTILAFLVIYLLVSAKPVFAAEALFTIPAPGTHEEYQLQMYEAGHNVFGQWSLNALQQKFTELSEEFSKAKEDRNLDNGVQPEFFTKEEMQKQTFFHSRRIKKIHKKEKV